MVRALKAAAAPPNMVSAARTAAARPPQSVLFVALVSVEVRNHCFGWSDLWDHISQLALASCVSLSAPPQVTAPANCAAPRSSRYLRPAFRVRPIDIPLRLTTLSCRRRLHWAQRQRAHTLSKRSARFSIRKSEASRTPRCAGRSGAHCLALKAQASCHAAPTVVMGPKGVSSGSQTNQRALLLPTTRRAERSGAIAASNPCMSKVTVRGPSPNGVARMRKLLALTNCSARRTAQGLLRTAPRCHCCESSRR
jgi:hypothetical protein